MGTGPISSTHSFNSIGDNLPTLTKYYEYEKGLFGNQGKSTSKEVRNIVSDNPIETAKDFYAKASFGGIETPLNNGKGIKTQMKDGTIITYREVSSSDGSPAVDINIKRSIDAAGIRRQKIHFVQKKGK